MCSAASTSGVSRSEARFWDKVEKSGECWNWRAAKGPRGYGHFYVGKLDGRRVYAYAHRYSWELANGAPGAFSVLHDCDNPSCVNPDHLFLGTHDDNMADMMAKGRSGCGERAHAARLSADQVRDIRVRFVAGRHGDLVRAASEFRVHKVTIFDILHRRTWKHV